tara:strand:+ start:3455 stop:4066 length:612 start_codon:yes stop_codon:yes gene_type:complete
MKKEDYLKLNDLVRVAQNHPKHPNRKGYYLSTFWKSPSGTTNIYDYVRLGDFETGEWFTVRFDNVVKIVNGKAVPFVGETKKKKKKQTRKAKKVKDDYPDRVIEWGQWLRYDLKDGSTIVRRHNTVQERYDNTHFETELSREKKIKKRWMKHIGWAVRPKHDDENGFVFVNSLESAEDYPFPFTPDFNVKEESGAEVVFEPAF